MTTNIKAGKCILKNCVEQTELLNTKMLQMFIKILIFYFTKILAYRTNAVRLIVEGREGEKQDLEVHSEIGE